MPFIFDEGFLEFLEGVESFLTDGREEWICEVDNQYETNCCYGFASRDAMYTLQYQQYGKADKVSVQEFLDRLHLKYPPKGVKYDKHGKITVGEKGLGNSARNAFLYAQNHGILFDSDWPFKKKVSSYAEREELELIRQNRRLFYVSGYNVINDGDHASVRRMLQEQTVTALIVGTRTLNEYSESVYPGPTDEEIQEMLDAQNNNVPLPYNNHIVLLVGFGVTKEGVPFYVAKDSNGLESGFRGFFKLAQTCCRAFVYPVGPCYVVDKAKGKQKEASPKKAKEKKLASKKKGNHSKAGSLTTHKQDGEQARLVLENKLAQMILHTDQEEQLYKAEKETHAEVQEELSNLKRKTMHMESVMKESMGLQELTRLTSEVQEKCAALGDELQERFQCLHCNQDNSAELSAILQPRDGS